MSGFRKWMSDSSGLSSEGKAQGAVDAMLVLCVHEADVTVRPAAGNALREMAQKTLVKMGRSLSLSKDAYVRFGLIQQDPTAGLAPGLAGVMPRIPGVDPRHQAALMGFKPMSTLAEEAAGALPSSMMSLLRERGLDASAYELKSFRESPDPGVTFLWMAAVRK